MRNPDRLDPFYNKLCKIHKEKFPDWRFGQLVFNFIRWYGDPFYLEEDKFIENKPPRYLPRETCAV
jgi:hypothetical protein